MHGYGITGIALEHFLAGSPGRRCWDAGSGHHRHVGKVGHQVSEIIGDKVAREVTGLTRDVESFNMSRDDLNWLSQRLRLRVANLQQFGLRTDVVEQMRSLRNRIDIVNAVVLDDGTSATDSDRAEVTGAVAALRRIAHSLTATATEPF